MAHTPGPWKCDEDGIYVHTWDEDAQLYARWLNIACCDRTIDHLRPNGAQIMDYAQRVANARLIAAAPDLLAALRNLVDHWGEDGCPFCDAARAAFAKAEG